MSSSRDSEEDISSHKRFKVDILNHETKGASSEPEADDVDDDAAKKLEHVHFAKTLKLNVGGHLFSTSLETLTKDPGSMLHAMFSGRFDTKPSEDGSYFIDRDGTHFRYILNYLRTGQLIVPEDKFVRRELLAEAEFYQVEGILDELKARPFNDSWILSSDQRQTLMNWLNDNQVHTTGNLFPVLLYRASRDGWTGAKFHSCCDNKGPTVTVVKSSKGNDLFGGYFEDQWESGDVAIPTNDSILFSIDNQSGEQEQHGICCFKKYGPVLRYGRDIVRVRAPENSENCSVVLNDRIMTVHRKFKRPNAPEKPKFYLWEMEVFGLEK